MKSLYLHGFFVICCLFITSFFLTRGIDLPYVGPYSFNYNTYSLIAHNYNHFGLLTVRFAPITSATKELPIYPNYYLHHPPLISLLEAILFKFFGEFFWVGRLTVIIFALGSLQLIYFIGLILKTLL